MYGMNVKVWHKRFGEFTLYNVTEVHASYGNVSETLGDGRSTAFESDFHSTGMVYRNVDLLEYEATIAKKLDDAFSS